MLRMFFQGCFFFMLMLLIICIVTTLSFAKELSFNERYILTKNKKTLKISFCFVEKMKNKNVNLNKKFSFYNSAEKNKK